LADEFKIKFLETSAKNSINVDEAFISLAKDIKKRLIDTDAEQLTPPTPVPLGPGPATSKKPDCC